MARTIEARVIQKIATEAEWLQTTLPLYKGEIALVRSGDRVVNMKVGNGTSKFSELNYVYNGGFNVIKFAKFRRNINRTLCS